MSVIGVDDLRVTHPCASDSEEPLDLHVLGMPPAFVLSQDQTLRCIECLTSVFEVVILSALKQLFPIDGVDMRS